MWDGKSVPGRKSVRKASITVKPYANMGSEVDSNLLARRGLLSVGKNALQPPDLASVPLGR